MSFNGQMVKLTATSVLISNERERTIDTCKQHIGWILKALSKGKKKPISRGYILYDSIYTTFLEMIKLERWRTD